MIDLTFLHLQALGRRGEGKIVTPWKLNNEINAVPRL